MNKDDSSTPTDTIAVRYERAAADFADGSRVRLEENQLEPILTRVGALDELGLDTEYNYLLVGLNWSDPTQDGLMILPEDITRKNPDTTEEESVAVYDRVAYLDAAIETLQRARAILTMRAAS